MVSGGGSGSGSPFFVAIILVRRNSIDSHSYVAFFLTQPTSVIVLFLQFLRQWQSNHNSEK